MATNLDPNLLNEAVRAGEHETKKAPVTQALHALRSGGLRYPKPTSSHRE